MDTTGLTNFKYLVNPAFTNAIAGKKSTILSDESISPDELNFYKRRIFALTKSILQGTPSDNTNINMRFERYAIKCIEHFKFNDKKTVIQGEYEGLIGNKSSNNGDYECNPDNLILRKPDPKVPKITDHINIKTTKTERKNIIPQIRKINLKDKIYKNVK
jgi:hypothetical protein